MYCIAVIASLLKLNLALLNLFNLLNTKVYNIFIESELYIHMYIY